MNTFAELQEQFRDGEISKSEFIERMHDGHRTLFEYSCLLSRCQLRSIEITKSGVVFISKEGLVFECDSRDRRAAPIEALNFGSYEGDDADLFWSLLEPGQTVIDIGAHIGWYAIHAAARFPTSRIVAFEPVPASYDILGRNMCGRNSLTNAVARPLGFGEKNGAATMYVDPALPTAASFANITGRGEPIEVQIVRLDKACEAMNLTPDVIKIDVEGSELFVLRGGSESLAKYQPAIFCEMLRKWSHAHGYHPDQTIGYMAALGYDCVYQSSDGMRLLSKMCDDTEARNFVFLHRVRHAERLKAVRQ